MPKHRSPWHRASHTTRTTLHVATLPPRVSLDLRGKPPGNPCAAARPQRRPPEPHQPLANEIQQFQPEAAFRLPTETLITAWRKSRKGTAPGPFGLTAEALRIVLDDEHTKARFLDTCQVLAQASIPPSIDALQKPNGGIRGLVVGDILRRVVARAIAQHFAQDTHAPCSPHQYALSTRAGTGARTHYGCGTPSPRNTSGMMGTANRKSSHKQRVENRGLTVLGVPLGSPEFVQHQLNQTLAAHPPLLQQLPHINDLQAAWLLLLYTASPRSNYLLRLLPPHVTETYAQEHDAATTECLAHLLGHYDMPATAIATAHLPLAQGGLGLAPARLLAPAAYSASW
ncbi:132 kDa protein, partial [Durusdinium trenchii]